MSLPEFPTITSLTVQSLDADFQEICWTVGESPLDTLDYTFQVLRSEGPEGPFEAICLPFDDMFRFVDGQKPGASKMRSLFYRLRVAHKATGVTWESASVQLEPKPDLIALEMRRLALLQLRAGRGRKCWVLPVRTFGQRCGCVNKTLNKKTRPNCLTCFDQGYVRGYFDPIETWADFGSSPQVLLPSEVGVELQPQDATATVPHYPPIKPNDLVVERENRRWRVTKVVRPERRRVTVHQVLTLHEIPERDIEYRIPIRKDRAVQSTFAPMRRTVPVRTDEEEAAIYDRIYSLYQPRA